VGRWALADPDEASVTCRYYGPKGMDGTGLLVTYVMQSPEEARKTGSWWKRNELKYRVLSEEGLLDKITVAVDSAKIVNGFTVAADGQSMSSDSLMVGVGDLGRADYVYIDSNDYPCDQNNIRWTSENLGARSAKALEEREKMRGLAGK
jgi:hypothetical protein